MEYSNVIRYIGGNQTSERKAFFEQVLARLPGYEICQFPNPMDALREIEDSEHVITLPILVESDLNPNSFRDLENKKGSPVHTREVAGYTINRLRTSLLACLTPIAVVFDNPPYAEETAYLGRAGATHTICVNLPKAVPFFVNFVREQISKPKV